MVTPSPSVTLCRYWVKAEKEAEFVALLEAHWPLLQSLDLVADEPPHLIFRGTDPERGIFYVETIAWLDPEAAERAHSLPEVAGVWEPMSDVCTSMELPSVEQIRP